jgi:hypothetical protein
MQDTRHHYIYRYSFLKAQDVEEKLIDKPGPAKEVHSLKELYEEKYTLAAAVYNNG